MAFHTYVILSHGFRDVPYGIYWKIPLLGERISSNFIWGENMKREKIKRWTCERKGQNDKRVKEMQNGQK